MRNGSTLNDFMQWDNTLFDDIILHNEIDKGILIATIMLRCGLQNPLYEDYDVFKSQVKVWFAAHDWNFTKLVNLLKENYNPLWNKDVHDEVSERVTFDGSETETNDTQENRTETGTLQKNGTETLSGTDAKTDTYNSQLKTVTDAESSHSETVNDDTALAKTTTENGTVTEIESRGNVHSVMGFNAQTWQPTDKDDANDNKTTTTNRTVQENGTTDETITKSGSDTDDKTETANKTGTDTESTQYGKITTVAETDSESVTEAKTTDHDRSKQENNLTVKTLDNWSYGNQGITTSQQMFLEECKLLEGFNLYDWIAKKFDDDLMIGVYVY